MRFLRGVVLGAACAALIVACSQGCAGRTPQPVAPDESPLVLSVQDGVVPSAALEGQVAGVDVLVLRQLLTLADARGARRAVYRINTQGGLLETAHDLAFLIVTARLRGIKVDCVVDGMGWSAGFYVLQQCDRRYMTRRSVLMTHEPHLAGAPVPDGGVEADNANELTRVSIESFAEGIQARLRVSPEAYRARVAGGRMWWMTARDALQAGAVDVVVRDVDEVLRGRP